MHIGNLSVEIFYDGADLDMIARAVRSPIVRGITTNPTTMKQAGITDYATFSKKVIENARGLPVSFAVLADDLDTIFQEAVNLSKLAPNVWVKIPAVTTHGERTEPILEGLIREGVNLNVTALMTRKQCEQILRSVSPNHPLILSLFAGRIADTGIDPIPVLREVADLLSNRENTRLLWASPREVLNVVQADQAGCDIITLTDSLMAKLDLFGKDLEEFSRETVKMFHEDGQSAGLTVPDR